MVGSKAEGLKFLKKSGFLVPDFYALSFDSLQNQSLSQIILDLQLPLSEIWAVRSSADAEDGENESYAGQFYTAINVSTCDLIPAVHKVIASYKRVAESDYGEAKQLRYGVIIQKMIRSEYSGVIFSHNPANPIDDTLFLNVIPGLGENLVSGKSTALTIDMRGRKITIENEDESFEGEIFDNGLKPVSQTGDELTQKIKPFLRQIYKGAKRLSKLKGFPVDIEFTIADGKLYWLQVRPITSKIQPESVVWDNSNIGENYPGLSLPLTVSFVSYTYRIAYSAMSRSLGFSKNDVRRNQNLFENMSGAISGALYYNVTSWQKLMYQLPFGQKTSAQITKIWNVDKADFVKPQKSGVVLYVKLALNLISSFIFFDRRKKRFEQKHYETLAFYEKFDFSSMSHSELIQEIRNIENKLLHDWISPMLNGFFTMIFFSGLKKIFSKSRLVSAYPNFINDILFSRGDVVSVKIVRDFSDILDAVANAPESLKSAFTSGNNAQTFNLLKTDFPKIFTLITKYIDNFGVRCDDGELKMETVDYKENPQSFIELIKKNMRQEALKARKSENFDYQAVLKSAYKFSPIKYFVLKNLIRITVNRVRDRENYRFFRTQTFALVRRVFRGMDADLLKNQLISDKNDSLYLTIQELMNIESRNSYKGLISTRKADYETFKTAQHANRYIQAGESFTVYVPTTHTNSDSKIKGVACSSGTITQTVHLVDAQSVQNGDFEGKILIAKYFEPGWINLFSHAAGVISEKGNLLSHTAILCREMGIPAIVGVKNLLTNIKHGDTVRMNGATGEIEICEVENPQNDSG